MLSRRPPRAGRSHEDTLNGRSPVPAPTRSGACSSGARALHLLCEPMRVSDLNLPADSHRVLNWGPPDARTIRLLSVEQFESDLQVLYDNLCAIAVGEVDFAEADARVDEARLNQEDVENWIFYMLGAHFASYTRRLWDDGPNGSSYQRLFPPSALQGRAAALSDAQARLPPRDSRRAWILAAFLATGNAAGLLGTSNSPEVDRFASASVHKTLEQLCMYSQMHELHPAVRKLADHWVVFSLAFLARRYRAMQDHGPQTPVGAVFTDLHLAELPLIAARDESMQAKHHAMRLDEVLEAQVGRLLESLGFFVVYPQAEDWRSIRGVIAIGRQTESPFSLLVIARSSARAYYLPVSDASRLAAWAIHVRDTLPDLPSLKGVLIVGSDASEALDGHLRVMSDETSLPCRFVGARTLVALRSLLPGPVPTDDFLREVIASGYVVDPAFPSRVADAVAEKQQSYQALADRSEW